MRSAARYLSAIIDRRLRLDHWENRAEPLELNQASTTPSVISEALGLSSMGKNSTCVAFEPLMKRPTGAPRLKFDFTLTGEFPKGVAFVLRQSQRDWKRTFRSTGPSWCHIIERSTEPYTLTMAAVAGDHPNGRLNICVLDEFGRTAEISMDLRQRGSQRP